MEKFQLLLDKNGKPYIKKLLGWNEPVLGEGMYPVNYDGEEWYKTTVEHWDYNYETVAKTKSNGTVIGNGNGKWANAMTEDGSQYVWIPRFSYKIISGLNKYAKSWNSDIVSGVDNELGKIEIKFSVDITDDTTDNYIVHPAFTFGDHELTGFWVAKYVASKVGATSNFGGLIKKPLFKPNVVAWRNVTIDEAFVYSYNLNLGLESHLMKNIEWGAVAYLTNAIGRVPYKNNSDDYVTGMSGMSLETSHIEPSYEYNTPIGVKASTTHNIYGIYDMNGCVYEFVSAYMDGAITDGAENLVKIEDKYKDVYKYNCVKKLGDAIHETSDVKNKNGCWDLKSKLYIPDSKSPFFIRGGCAVTENCGIFTYCSVESSEESYIGFRVALCILKNE